MPYGDIVSVLERGPLIRAKALQPMGVYNESICWGVWVRDRPLAETLECDVPDLERKEDPHLLISPVHPNIWPFVFRLHLELLHEQGSLDNAARILNEEGVNIIFTEGTASGYRKATWNVIGEAVKVRQDILEREKQGEFESAAHKELETAKALLEFLKYLSNILRAKNRQFNFLHDGLVNEGYLNSFKRSEIGDAMWSDHRHQIVRGVAYSVTPNLTYLFRCIGVEKEAPIRFRYNLRTNCLISDPSDEFTERLSREGFDLPAWAVASFNTAELHVRLQILCNELSKSIVTFDLHYETEKSSDLKEHPVNSKGLLSAISKELTESPVDVNLLRISNVITEFQDLQERGIVSLMAWVEDTRRSALDSLKERLKSLEQRFDSLIKIDPHIVPLRMDRIFVSINFDVLEEEKLKKAIFKAAKLSGFTEENIVFSRSYVDSVTDRVVEEVRSCKGFLQVAVDQGKVAWMIAEYAMAVALGLVRVRVVDTSGENHLREWRDALKLEKERSLMPFSVEDGEETMVSTFREAFEQIAEEIYRR